MDKIKLYVKPMTPVIYSPLVSGKEHICYLKEPLKFHVKNGTRIKFSNGIYRVVDKFLVGRPGRFLFQPKPPPYKKKIKQLPVGTIIYQENGIPISLIEPLTIRIANNTQIIVPIGTKVIRDDEKGFGDEIKRNTSAILILPPKEKSPDKKLTPLPKEITPKEITPKEITPKRTLTKKFFSFFKK